MAKRKQRGARNAPKNAKTAAAPPPSAPPAKPVAPARDGLQQRVLAGRLRRKRIRMLRIGSVALVAVALLVAFLVPRGPEVGEAIPALSGIHGGSFLYNSRPPTSGNHSANPLPAGFTDQLIAGDAAVHSMEHGSVVLWYQPGNADLTLQMSQLVRGLGSSCLVAGQYADMDTKVAATAWGRLLALDEFDDQQLREFVSAYQGQSGPEAGNCRTQA